MYEVRANATFSQVSGLNISNETKPWFLKYIFTARVWSTREGNVLTGVCPSTGRGVPQPQVHRAQVLSRGVSQPGLGPSLENSPGQDWGIPHPGLVPPSRTGVPPPTRTALPPGQDLGIPLARTGPRSFPGVPSLPGPFFLRREGGGTPVRTGYPQPGLGYPPWTGDRVMLGGLSFYHRWLDLTDKCFFLTRNQWRLISVCNWSWLMDWN